jgi:hypothetical protein
MKKQVTFLLSTVAVVALSMIACAPREPLHGTWANQDYQHGYWTWRFIYGPDGVSRGWDTGVPSDQPNNGEGRYSIDKKWTDSEGNTWYRIAGKGCIAPYSEAKATRDYGLVKIDVSGKMLEGEWSSVDFPSEFGALGNKHFTYSRE